VFEKIMGRYCHPRGFLRFFTVRQIMEQAIHLRELFLEVDKRLGREPEDWYLDMHQIDLL